jgi:hypothetical protein
MLTVTYFAIIPSGSSPAIRLVRPPLEDWIGWLRVARTMPGNIDESEPARKQKVGVLRHACPELAEGLSTNGGKPLTGNIPFALSLSKRSESMF